MWADFVDWLDSISREYGVDPVVYAALYIGSAPFFFGSLAWLAQRLRHRGSLLTPALSTAFFFSLPTLYVLLAGRNLPWWAYVALAVLTAVGVVSVARRLRAARPRSD